MADLTDIQRMGRIRELMRETQIAAVIEGEMKNALEKLLTTPPDRAAEIGSLQAYIQALRFVFNHLAGLDMSYAEYAKTQKSGETGDESDGKEA